MFALLALSMWNDLSFNFFGAVHMTKEHQHYSPEDCLYRSSSVVAPGGQPI